MSRGLDQDALAAAGDGTYGSIRDMLVHVVSAQELFLSGMTGTPSASDIAVGMEFPGLPVPARAYASRGRSADRALGVSRSRRGADGRVRRPRVQMRLVAPLMQSFSHAVEHRTQIATICGQRGIEHTPIDVWGWAKPFG